MPIDYLKKDGVRKSLLKDILSDYVPKELYDRPKQGFTVPLEKWLCGALFEKLILYANNEILAQQGLFNAKFINYCICELKYHSKNSKFFAKHLWNFYIFQQWYQRYIQDLWRIKETA